MQKNETLQQPALARPDQWIWPAAALASAAALISPRTAQASFAVLALIPAGALLARTPRPRLAPLPTLMLALAALGLYLALNALWSVDRVEALGKVLFYGVLISASYLAVAGMGRLTEGELAQLSRGLTAGLALGAAFLAIEALFDQPLKRLLYNALPATRPSPKHLRVADGSVTQIGLYVLNRGLGVLCLLLWPALLQLRALLPRQLWRGAAGILAALTVAAVFPSEHETSMLALIISGAVFAGMWFAAPLMRALVLAGWLVATLLVVPIALASYGAGLHQARWIPETGRNRIILWGFTANEVRKAPLLGVGVSATREIDEQAAPTAAKPADHSYPLRTGRHSHNIYMQAWYELGAVGALLLSAAGLALLSWLSRLPRDVQPFAYASFVAAAVMGAFSWGLWQTWFLAAYGLSALALALALALHRQDASTATKLPRPTR